MEAVGDVTERDLWVFFTFLTMFLSSAANVLLGLLLWCLLFGTPLIYFLFRAFQMVVVAMANICAMALIDFPSCLSIRIARFTPTDSSLVFMFIATFTLKMQSAQKKIQSWNWVLSAIYCLSNQWNWTQIGNKKHLSVIMFQTLCSLKNGCAQTKWLEIKIWNTDLLSCINFWCKPQMYSVCSNKKELTLFYFTKTFGWEWLLCSSSCTVYSMAYCMTYYY